MKKRILALFMAFLFVVSSINVFPVAANENAAEEDVPVVV